MRVPLYLLAVPTVVGGLLVADPALALGARGDEELFHWDVAVVMTAVVLVSAGVWLWLWRRNDGSDPWAPPVQEVVPPIDRAYDLLVVRPVDVAAGAVVLHDRDVVDTYADGAGATARGLGWALRLAQNGNVQAYLMVLVVGVAALAVAAGVLS
jgi:NADH:ubiquinone oxidoreductase subunit 5 (subunit L)/multisubunit Na+/H+ antiporter MnhA subunit